MAEAKPKKESKGNRRYGHGPKIMPKEGKGDTDGQAGGMHADKKEAEKTAGSPEPKAGEMVQTPAPHDAGRQAPAHKAAEKTAGTPKEPVGNLAAPAPTGIEGTTGTEKQVPSHEETHARDMKDMHARHAKEMEDMHARHSEDHKKLAKRHAEAAGY